VPFSGIEALPSMPKRRSTTENHSGEPRSGPSPAESPVVSLRAIDSIAVLSHGSTSIDLVF
jgi:hypothetical protein